MNDSVSLSLSVGQALEVQDALRRQGLGLVFLKKATAGDWFSRLHDVMEGRAQIVPVVKSEEVAKTILAEVINLLTVPADVSFAERIARGQYDWTSDNLTEKRFPVTTDQIGEFEWKLFHFDRNISSEEAIRLMKKEGYDAGAIGHILVFGEQCPEEQRKYPIIALGSVAEVYLERLVPGLWDDHVRRGLRLPWFDLVWSPFCRFLGVRKRSVA